MVGGTYPLHPVKQMYINCLAAAQFLLMGLVMMAAQMLDFFQYEKPQFVRDLHANRFGACMFLWLFGNIFMSVVGNTGAFEVYYQDKVAWSTLSTPNHRLPNGYDIMNGLESVGVEMVRSAMGK